MGNERILFFEDGADGGFPIRLMKDGLAHLNDKGGSLFLDLSRARTIDSRTIGAVVNLTNKYNKSGNRFILRNVNESIIKIFDFMNLTQFLTIEQISRQNKQDTECEKLTVDYDTIGKFGIFRFNGAIDSSCDSAMFLNIINKIVGDGNPMLIDMSGITSIDSLGVGVIIRLIKLMREGKAEVRFFGASEHLAKIFHINQLDSVINIYPSAEEAMKGFA